MLFADRAEAGSQLAGALVSYRKGDPYVLALPRGGVVVGFQIARALDAPLDIISARKLGAPGQQELAIGAIAPGGICVVDPRLREQLRVTEEMLAHIVARENAEMERRLRLYRGTRREPDLSGRTVILVDDGLATGMTALAAVRSVRRFPLQQLVLATPVCSPEAAALLQPEVTALVCLSIPPDFQAVGLWYRAFDQVSDAEVTALLRQSDAVGETDAGSRSSSARRSSSG